MEIKWPNVVAFALAVFAFFTAVRMREEIAAFFDTMRHFGPGDPTSSKIHGLMAFGLVLVALLGLLKLLFNSQNGKR